MDKVQRLLKIEILKLIQEQIDIANRSLLLMENLYQIHSEIFNDEDSLNIEDIMKIWKTSRLDFKEEIIRLEKEI